MKIKNRIGIAIVTALVLTAAFGCSLLTNESGTVRMQLTDAPLTDASNVEGVYITIESIAYHTDDQWIEAVTFDEPEPINLLDLTGGTVEHLANVELPAGTIDQIRFHLSATEDGRIAPEQPGSYISFIDGETITTEALFVPSGAQTGYKATGSFNVPANGQVTITADFDVRKSVRVTARGTGDERYLLKPTIRLVVNDQAGEISGDFIDNGSGAYDSYIVFAYDAGSYDGTVEEDSEAPFANAVSSAKVEDGRYILPFIAEGEYDLIVAGFSDESGYEVIEAPAYESVTVDSQTQITADLEVTSQSSSL
ncbi:MAG: DUF4382 domain-containing protein [Spirochaetota bacterium]